MKAVILCASSMLITFSRLIRWPNILIAAGVQYLVFFSLLEWRQSVMSWLSLTALVVVTACITAAGNVINDYYDRETDAINKPDRAIVDVTWPARYVIVLYIAIIALGAIVATVFAIAHDMVPFLPVYIVAVAGLHLYSSHLKCQPLIGNFWVSLYCGGVVLVVAIPDMVSGNGHIVSPAIWYYIVFAMLTTLHREITKDIQDVTGDMAAQCRTFVVRYGIRAGKIASVIAAVAGILFIYVWDREQVNNSVKILLLALQGGLIGSIALIWWAKDTSYYAKASALIKLVMIAGTLLLLLNPSHA